MIRSRDPLPMSSANVTPLPTSQRRAFRNSRAYQALYDPLVQGVIAMTTAAMFLGLAWALRSNGLFAIALIPISATVGCVVAFLVMVGRAARRDRAARYWVDRRALRLEVARHRAETQLCLTAILQADAQRSVARSDLDAALAAFGDAVREAFATRRDDVAVLMWRESEDHRVIVRGSVADGTRFGSLKPGRRCALSRDLDATLRHYAPYSWHCSADATDGRIGLAVLSFASFDEDDSEVLRWIEPCLRLVATAPAEPTAGEAPKVVYLT